MKSQLHTCDLFSNVKRFTLSRKQLVNLFVDISTGSTTDSKYFHSHRSFNACDSDFSFNFSNTQLSILCWCDRDQISVFLFLEAIAKPPHQHGTTTNDTKDQVTKKCRHSRLSVCQRKAEDSRVGHFIANSSRSWHSVRIFWVIVKVTQVNKKT